MASQAISRDLLLRCASGHFDAEAQAGLQARLKQGVDWEYLLEAGTRHGLLPLVYDRLRSLDGGRGLVPQQVMADLESTFYTNLMRTQRLSEELEAVLTALHAGGVAAIVLKGGALAWTVYPHPGQRPMVDLDLLIRPEQIAQAGAALESGGFRLSPAAPAHLLPFQQRFGGGIEWLRQGSGWKVPMDLQHGLVGVDCCRNAFAVDDEAIWEAARPLAVGSTRAWQLSAEDTLIHLCLHPALHDGYASRLIGYVDMDRVIAGAGSEAFWGRFLERVVRFRLRTVAYYGLLAALRLLATPVPAEVLAALEPGSLRLRALQWLSPWDEEAVIRRVGRIPAGSRQLLLYAALMDRARDVGGMVRHILWPDREWLALRYSLTSEAQARRYRLIHPLRVARAFARALYRPLRKSGLD